MNRVNVAMQTEVYGGMTAASATVGAKIGKIIKREEKKKKKVGKKAEKTPNIITPHSIFKSF